MKILRLKWYGLSALESKEWRICMKKLAVFITLIMIISGLAGCSKNEKFLDVDKITASTLLAKSNGVIQVATVEAFDKSYYKLNDLEEFVASEIETYNQKAGKDKVKIDDIMMKGTNAVMVLTYSGMDQYATFNKETAAYFNGGVSDVPLNLPATLINEKNGSLVSTQEIIQNSSYKILVLNEPYNIVVDGKIKYYSENAKFQDNNEIQSAGEGMTVVVFK